MHGCVLENKRAKTHMMHVWIISVRYKWAIGFGEGRGPTWPFRTHHVDGGVWNVWVLCACANHTRPTRGTGRKLGFLNQHECKIGKDTSTNPAQVAS
jgi:hypothetical protein